MILSFDQIKNIILKNPNKALITKGREYRSRLRVHIYGDGKDSALPVINGFEKPTLQKLRVKYAKSNKDLMARLSRPMDKVFSARGGSVYYNLGEGKDKKAASLSAEIVSGKSIKQWVENNWAPHYRDDPYGIIFMEIAMQDAAQRLRAEGKSYVYPTYKNISTIYDYSLNGSGFDYIVFEVSKQQKILAGLEPEAIVYRLVDDAMDYFVKREGETITVIEDLSFPNFFLKVPGIINSDIEDTQTDSGRLSIFDEILELADEFLLKGSIKVTHDFLHGFPKYWEYADNCQKCNGTRFFDGKECVDCKGTGKKLMTSVSDNKLLSYPESKDSPLITPNVAGYVSPDKTFYEISVSDKQMLSDLMSFTIWGNEQQQKTQGLTTDNTKTATEIISNIKPQEDRLHGITESAEKRHKFILDCAIMIMVDNNYKGSTVNYGKRYGFESHDELWEKYIKSKQSGASESALNDLLLEYYETKYDSDPVRFAIQKKLMLVEPFVHLTTAQLKTLDPDEKDYKAKLYFGEWLSTMNDAMLLVFTEDMLRENLKKYVEGKELMGKEEKEVIE